MTGPIVEWMGDMPACVIVCLDLVLTSNLLSCGKSQPSLADETPQRGFRTIALGESVFT